MDERLFNNTQIISWLQYFSSNTDIDLEHVKILDITRKNKNTIMLLVTVTVRATVILIAMFIREKKS